MEGRSGRLLHVPPPPPPPPPRSSRSLSSEGVKKKPLNYGSDNDLVCRLSELDLPEDLIRFSVLDPAPGINLEGESLALGDVVVIDPYGYGIFDGCDPSGHYCYISLPWADIVVPRSSVCPWVVVHITSFVDDMPSFKLPLRPSDPLIQLKFEITKHFELEDARDLFQLAFKGAAISEEDFRTKSVKDFFSNCINPSVLFVLVPVPEIQFESESVKPFVALSAGGRTVEMLASRQWVTFKSQVGYTNGKHIWTVKLDHCTNGNITLGVVTEGASRSLWVGGDSRGYGYLGDCSLWRNGARDRIYGDVFKSGDIVEVILDMDGGKLSFVKNGQEYGKAFEKLPKLVYPAFSLFDRGDTLSVTKCVNASSYSFEDPVVRIRTFKRRKIWVDMSRKTCGRFQLFAGDKVRIPSESQVGTIVGFCCSPEPYSGNLVVYSPAKNGVFLVTSDSVACMTLIQSASRKTDPAKILKDILIKVSCK